MFGTIVRSGAALAAVALLAHGTAAAQDTRTKEELEREKEFQKRAKEVADSTKKYGWHRTLAVGANLSQVSYTDWVGGGQNSLAYTAWAKGEEADIQTGYEWSNRYRLAFGQTKLGGDDIRKTEDELYFESLYLHRIGTYINPYASLTLRTQFARGYLYEPTLQPVSKFWDPAYLTQSVGLAYQPMPEIITRFGVGLREIFASEFAELYTDDKSTPELEKSLVQGGLESITTVTWPIWDNVLFTSSLEFFAPFESMDRIIVRSNNALLMKVNDYLTANLTFDLIQDPYVSPRTQFKQGISLGVGFTLF